jgi:hypothetical protein
MHALKRRKRVTGPQCYNIYKELAPLAISSRGLPMEVIKFKFILFLQKLPEKLTCTHGFDGL